ncbi:MAG: hypothetical protein N2260_10020 [Syntrophobacterales bacterium]|nr:hypothetical protein [Syntrophobacterales bacterium]
MEELNFPYVSAGLETISSLKPEEIGVVMARAGVGKTAFLCLLALEEIRQGGRVLHVCVDETPDKIKTWYEEILRTYCKNLPRAIIKEMVSKTDPLRFIASFLHNSFSLQRLRELTTNLIEQANFIPTLIIMDGLDVERFDETFFSSLKAFLIEKRMPLWMSARMHGHIKEQTEGRVPYPCDTIEGFLNVVLILEHDDQNTLRIRVVKNREDFPSNLYLPFPSPMFK